MARLDQVLTLAQEAKQQDRLAPERYAEFLKQFRASLDEARAATPPSPVASALYARILARLGDPKQAMAILAPALDQDPENASLRVALGHVRFEEKNYPAAYAEAEAVLKREPKNKEALALKYFSKGRIDGTASVRGPLPASGLEEASLHQDPRIAEAGRRALARKSAIGFTDKAMGRLKIKDPGEALRYLALAEAIDPGYADVPMQQGLAYADLKRHAAAVERFTQAEALWRARSTPQTDELAGLARQLHEREAAELIQSSKSAQPEATPQKRNRPSPKNDGVPLWPLFPAYGLGAVAFVVAKSRRTVESEDGFNEDDRPQPGKYQRLVAGSILAGLSGAALYLVGAYVVGTGAPLAAQFMAGPGKQAVQLAQSEVGAVNPSGILRIGNANLKLSQHAVERISQRGLSLAEIESALVEARGFQYFHDGAWKIGYYDPVSRIFVGQQQGRVITVISNVKPQYIENLRGLKP